MSVKKQILQILQTESSVSETQLQQRLGVSITAIRDAMAQIVNLGVRISCNEDGEYRVNERLELLDANKIAQTINRNYTDCFSASRKYGKIPDTNGSSRLHVLDEVGSTNTFLMNWAKDKTLPGRSCIAEYQTLGRGRRGKQWVASGYRNILLSVGWVFANGASHTMGLSLAAGVVIAETLEKYGLDKVMLKWPNDFLYRGQKLGGILIELGTGDASQCRAVLGVGLNLAMSNHDGGQIGQRWTAINQFNAAKLDRNALAGDIIFSLYCLFAQFEESGLATYHSRWQRRDAFAGCLVRTNHSGKTLTGIAQGIDRNGCFQIRASDGGLHKVVSGSLEMVAA